MKNVSFIFWKKLNRLFGQPNIKGQAGPMTSLSILMQTQSQIQYLIRLGQDKMQNSNYDLKLDCSS